MFQMVVWGRVGFICVLFGLKILDFVFFVNFISIFVHLNYKVMNVNLRFYETVQN